jgi:protein TonB
MQNLIVSADRTLDKAAQVYLVDFVRLKREEVIQRRKIKPRKPQTPEQPPPDPPSPQMDDLEAGVETIAIPAAPVNSQIELTGGGFSLGVGEGDYLPIVKVAPIYPQRALISGIEGYCVVEFTVTKLGTVREPRIIESECTNSLFHRVSLQASLKFKYKPRVIDGVAIDVPGVLNKFTFEITDDT